MNPSLVKNAPPAGKNTFVKEGTTQSFIKDVIEGSQQTLVLVDLWAPWCGPCRQLTPVLEKAVAAQQGKVVLVKINIEQHPQIAQSLQVQSIPAVYAFYQGQPVDGFMGALPESQVNAFIAKLIQQFGAAMPGGLPGGFDVQALLDEAAAHLAGKHYEKAAALYQMVLAAEPEQAVAYIGLLRVALAAQDLPQTRQLVQQAPETVKHDKAWLALQPAVALAEKAASLPALAALQAAAHAAPSNHQARYDYALALYAAGDAAQAMAELLEIIRRERGWQDHAARKALVDMFEALGNDAPQTIAGRRQLSAILFA